MFSSIKACLCKKNSAPSKKITDNTNKLKIPNLRHSFLLKVLIALKLIQNEKKTEKPTGVKLNDIVNWMENKYCLNGDICSQIVNSLNVAKEYRYIKKRGNYYSLIQPVACLQYIPQECVDKEITRIDDIFIACSEIKNNSSSTVCSTTSKKSGKKKNKRMKFTCPPFNGDDDDGNGTNLSCECDSTNMEEFLTDCEKYMSKQGRKRKQRNTNKCIC